RKGKYQRSAKSKGPRTYRTRIDPFAEVNEELFCWLQAEPQRTAKSLFVELQRRYPNQFPDVQLRTLQRRVASWRTKMIIEFNDDWLQQEAIRPTSLPTALRGSQLVNKSEPPLIFNKG